MSNMRTLTILCLAVLVLPTLLPMAQATQGRAVNIDLEVGDIDITYADSTNQSLYQMFSSNYPISNFNRPELLYVTDGVLGVPLEIDIIVNNLGSVQSGFITFDLLILHNEYTHFELLNFTSSMTPISGASAGSIMVPWTPTYAGNHTLQISVSNANGDDNNANNDLSRHFTIANIYDNCDDLSQWVTTGQFGTNSDTSISQSSACHVGSGSSSTYSANTVSTLITPIIDMTDGLANHNRAIGFSFFYTGGAGTGDELKGYVKDGAGNWDELFSVSGSIDSNFNDGVNWQTWSVAFGGRNSPLIPIQAEHLHANTQFKLEFTSDASGEDIGFWIDDMVFIYDQAARKEEFNVDIGGVSTLGGLPGDWSVTRMRATNTGNISELFTPIASGLPIGWNHYFAKENGANIGSNGIELLPGQSFDFDLRVMVDENASQGNLPVTVNLSSNTHSDIMDSLNTIIKVLPDREPDIIVPEITPRCAPGSTCEFPITLENIGEATDVFTIDVADKNIPAGWSIDLSLNQSNSVLVRTDSPVELWLTVTTPADAPADTTAEVWLTATSTNDSRRLDTEVIEVAAAMTSNAEITVDAGVESLQLIEAGDIVDVTFRIYNNASRMDIFRPQIEATTSTGWSVVLLTTPDLAINPGSSSTYSVRISAPQNAQAQDPGPMISPKALSLRSGELIIGDGWQGLRVDTLHDLKLNITLAPTILSPGSANLINILITNDGNGADTAVIDLPWVPDTWVWWALHEGSNVTDGVPLSVSYDLQNIKEIDLWLVLPSLESAGEHHEITISVSPEIGDDIAPEDNSEVFEAVTEVVRSPRLDGIGQEMEIETGSIQTINATAWNIGNAADSTIRARLEISTSPPTNFVIGFLSSSTGASVEAGVWINLNLGPTESIDLIAEILVNEETALNTRISVKIELEGGSDEIGRPILHTLDSMLMVTKRRAVNLGEISPLEGELDSGSAGILWVNLSSTSTQSETISINASAPEGWGVLCDGNAIHLEPITVELETGHLNPQKYNIRCEIMRQTGEHDGKVEIFITNADGTLNQTISSQLSWSQPPVEEGIISTNQVIIIVGSVLLLAVIIMVLRRRNGDEEDEVEPVQLTQAAPTQVPATTAFAGPPSTTQPVVQAPAPAMSEYEQQVAEYNRKLAEYETWQAAQGSQ
ncbi:MAG TPA: hypothetical protein EYQ73_05880 [Candidatus Poseidoniales archaeon]|nr:hypothetical protein [Candidatus Poseidoniales archaeon]